MKPVKYFYFVAKNLIGLLLSQNFWLRVYTNVRSSVNFYNPFRSVFVSDFIKILL